MDKLGAKKSKSKTNAFDKMEIGEKPRKKNEFICLRKHLVSTGKLDPTSFEAKDLSENEKSASSANEVDSQPDEKSASENEFMEEPTN